MNGGELAPSDEAYLGRLRADLSRWVREGRISPQLAEDLARDAQAHARQVDASASSTTSGESARSAMPVPRQRGNRMVGAMFTLAGVLLAAGLLSFVAANWDSMSRLARLAWVMGGLWGGGLLAVWLREKAGRLYAEGMFLLTALAFGGAMALVAQIFHISGDPERFLLTWSMGALALGALMGSEAASVAGLLLALGWSLVAIGELNLAPWVFMTSRPMGSTAPWHWPFLLPLLVAAGLTMLHRWRWLAQVVVFALLAWLTYNLATLGASQRAMMESVFRLLPFVGLLAALTGVWLARASNEEARLFAIPLIWQGTLHAWGFSLLVATGDLMRRVLRELAGGGLPQEASGFWPHVALVALALLALAGVVTRRIAWWEALPPLVFGLWQWGLPYWPAFLVSKWVAGGLSLMLAVWLMALGLEHERKGLWRLGMALFGLAVFWLYVVTIGSLLGTAGFFLGAGLLLLVLALGGWRFLAWLERRQGEMNAQPPHEEEAP